MSALKVPSTVKQSQLASLKKLANAVCTSSDRGDHLDDLPDGFECAVCGELMVVPTSCVPCGHSFCEPCLRLWAKGSGWFSTPCPICRTSIIDTRENTDLRAKIKSSTDARIATAYGQRSAWLAQQRRISKMRLPGGFYSPLAIGFDSFCELTARCAGGAFLFCAGPILVPAIIIAAILLCLAAAGAFALLVSTVLMVAFGLSLLVFTCCCLCIVFVVWSLVCIFWPEVLMDLLDCVVPGRSWFVNV